MSRNDLVTIGVDPGTVGGAIAIRDRGQIILKACPLGMKVGANNCHDPRAMFEILRPYINRPVVAILEQVHFDDRDDGKRRKAESLIRSHEGWNTVLAIAGIETYHLAPKTWRKMAGLPTGLKDEVLIVQAAIKRYPTIAPIIKRRSTRSKKGYVYNHNMAEALLMTDAVEAAQLRAGVA